MGSYIRMPFMAIICLIFAVPFGASFFTRDLLAASVEDIALMKSPDRQKVLFEAKKEGKVIF